MDIDKNVKAKNYKTPRKQHQRNSDDAGFCKEFLKTMPKDDILFLSHTIWKINSK